MKLNIKQTARHLGKNVQVNSPTILSAVAVVGVAATGYLTFKATWKGARIYEDKKTLENVHGEGHEWTTAERALLIWKLYIPAVATGVGTIGCIVASNRIQARRAAAMIAAYGVISGDFDEYKEKARELLGAKKADEVDQHMAKKDIDKAVVSTKGILVPDGKSWFLDSATKRTLITTRETIESAKNEMNGTILNKDGGNGDVSLNDFYSQIGLDPAEGIGDLLGWNKNHLCQIEYTPMLTEDRGAVTAFHFRRGPVPNYWKSQLTQKEFDELANASDD